MCHLRSYSLNFIAFLSFFPFLFSSESKDGHSHPGSRFMVSWHFGLWFVEQLDMTYVRVWFGSGIKRGCPTLFPWHKCNNDDLEILCKTSHAWTYVDTQVSNFYGLIPQIEQLGRAYLVFVDGWERLTCVSHKFDSFVFVLFPFLILRFIGLLVQFFCLLYLACCSLLLFFSLGSWRIYLTLIVWRFCGVQFWIN